LHCQSFAEMASGSGAFDYVICHGVYSWVPAPLRETILRICRENLSPRGVALISYNVREIRRRFRQRRADLRRHRHDQIFLVIAPRRSGAEQANYFRFDIGWYSRSLAPV
jgi:SAM-dependent methyltransferase